MRSEDLNLFQQVVDSLVKFNRHLQPLLSHILLEDGGELRKKYVSLGRDVVSVWKNYASLQKNYVSLQKNYVSLERKSVSQGRNAPFFWA